jgi:hypothetical protein
MSLAVPLHKSKDDLYSELERRNDEDLCEENDEDDCDEKISLTWFKTSTLITIPPIQHTFPSVTIPTALTSTRSIQVGIDGSPLNERVLTESLDNIAGTNLGTDFVSFSVHGSSRSNSAIGKSGMASRTNPFQR